ncbi:MAG: helix-turn-helix domain-containing protein [archaeon]
MERNTDLERLGFSANEAKVYLTLLRLGPSLAGNIAKTASLDRSSTYGALELLKQRGVISTYYENKRTIFVPEDPKKIVDYFAEKQEIAKTVITKINETVPAQKSQTVKLFKGYRGLKTVFQDILDSSDKNSVYQVMGSQGQFTKSMPYYSPLFRKMKEKKRIRTQLITKTLPENPSKSTEYRIVPSDVDSPVTFNVYKDKIAIILWEDGPQAIVIQNELAAKTFGNYFNFIWKHSKNK